MKKRLLFCSLLGLLTACQREGDIQPNPTTLAGEVVGTYRTNFYLDLSCVAIPADQMPFAEVKAESDSSISLIYTQLYPTRTQRLIQHVRLSRQAEGIQFRLADLSVGTLQTDRIFTNNGMEKEGKLLRINVQGNSQNPVYFTGFRQ